MTSARGAGIDELRVGLGDADSAVRYWAATGALVRGSDAVAELAGPLRRALADEDPAVRIVSGEALGRYGSDADAGQALPVLLDLADGSRHGIYVAMAALNAIDYMNGRSDPALDRILALPAEVPGQNPRFRAYLPNLLAKIRSDAGRDPRQQ